MLVESRSVKGDAKRIPSQNSRGRGASHSWASAGWAPVLCCWQLLGWKLASSAPPRPPAVEPGPASMSPQQSSRSEPGVFTLGVDGQSSLGAVSSHVQTPLHGGMEPSRQTDTCVGCTRHDATPGVQSCYRRLKGAVERTDKGESDELDLVHLADLVDLALQTVGCEQTPSCLKRTVSCFVPSRRLNARTRPISLISLIQSTAIPRPFGVLWAFETASGFGEGGAQLQRPRRF